MVTDIIREYMHKECRNESNVFGTFFFEQHILIVQDYAGQLAGILNADREVVDISAYLHDIAAIRDYSTVSRHPEIGAGIAEGILSDSLYDKKKIPAVKQCILTHSNPLKTGSGTLEEVCLSNADAISQIINPAYWLYYSYCVKGFGFEKGSEWYSARVESNWNNLIGEAKDLIRDKYLLTKSLLTSLPYEKSHA